MKIHCYKEPNSPYWVAVWSRGGITQGKENELVWWCYNNFGPGLGEFRLDNSPFVHRWVNDIKWGELRFSQEKDLEWFVLKWNNNEILE